MEKKHIIVSGKILAYYTNTLASFTDTSEVLVFLHGWMQDGKSFEKIFHILEEKDIAYISLDLPGFGESPLLHTTMTIDDYASIVGECIEKLSLKKPILVGHSFGGRISIYLGSYYKNVSKIILICAAGIQTSMPIWKHTFIKAGKIFFSLPGLKSIGNKIRYTIASPDMKNAGKMETIFRNTIAQDLQNYMKQVSLPTLMIWGKDDDQTPVSEALLMHQHIQDSQLHILEGSHFVYQERPQEVTKLIIDFLKR